MSSNPSTSNSQQQQPEWFGPFPSVSSASASVLKVNNSLTSSLVPFIPASGPDSKFISWYICGPTVYDSAHLGHARAYVTFDIIRRILTDYFNYNLRFVMNITDVDDKIIMRARKNFLFEEFSNQILKDQNQNFFIQIANKSFTQALDKSQKKISELNQKINAAQSENAKHLADLQETLKGENLKNDKLIKEQILFNDLIQQNAPLNILLNAASSVISDSLDKEKGDTVKDHSIFKAWAQRYEAEFLDDMKALNVRPPDALTRVTEYIKKITDMVQDIIDNKFAYVRPTGVYFDVAAFKAAGRPYAKLSPSKVGNLEALLEGEGALSVGGEQSDKRSSADFALWKASKPGEPVWPSPWFDGRPGWHIECSAMAVDLLGKNIDIHAGGVDLKFPHHDNEIAQSEAATGSKQWINHFWHAGHLNIEGLKMSKSLKNFKTIREILNSVSARTIRFLFLSFPWDSGMDFSDDSLENAKIREKYFIEFLGNIAANIRAAQPIHNSDQTLNEEDRKIDSFFRETQTKVDEAFKNNFNFHNALTELEKLILETNKYRNKAEAKVLILSQIQNYVFKILNILGVFADGDISSVINGGAEDKRVPIILNSYADVRDTLRQLVKALSTANANPNSNDNNNNENSSNQLQLLRSELIKLTDSMRDGESMVSAGVRIEDDTLTGKSLWKLADPAQLIKERADEQVKKIESERKKLKAALADLQSKIKKMEGGQLSPKDFFALQKDKYQTFDSTGKPTSDAAGKELSKSALKAIEKDWANQEKLHAKFSQEALVALEQALVKKESELRNFQALHPEQ